MKILLVLGLFVFLQLIPEQTNKADSGQNASQQLQGITNPAKTTTLTHHPSSDPENNGSDGQANQPSWCERIFAPVISNWPVLAVAIWGILVAMGTLDTIREQTKATKASAEAALLNAEAVIHAERAWLTVKVVQPPPESMKEVKRRVDWMAGIVFELTNCGRTPATISDSYIRAVIVRNKKPGIDPVDPELSEQPDYETDRERSRIPIRDLIWMPRARFKPLVVIDRQLFRGDFDEWLGSNTVLCIYGSIKYRDVFQQFIENSGSTQKTHHETRFCYVYQLRPRGSHLVTEATPTATFPPGFSLGGPDAYNQAT